RRVLQAHGEYQIDEAYDGEAGLEMVRQAPPDLILLDLMMPRLDGFGLLDALKAD
ncbi:MAG: response regulator, partial [Anaerolineae bacterium]|nr:response regulator [Anaerolineae bacterium]